ncbi:related to BNR/Asp-box repeat domain protein [Fusarium oxysporum]|uniref:Related to BNR/Asp-box repeat domain protein n=1 Tax=Fusarium oxysporum TaxID=5507 RepID=A0A2H3SJR6_FUSOX|nr:related to BNR/Asp-box repeat domain protein [Fusarium oxysporum]
MIFSCLFATAVLTTSSLAASLAPRAVTPWSNFNDNAVFYPKKEATSWRTLYGRTLQLPDKSLLLSWEDYDPDVEFTYFPIYKSTDGGATYTPFSRVQDQVNGWGNWYQPFLYALPQDFGGYSQGTILLAGVSTPRNLTEAYIDLYASKNQGKDWEFVSHIVYGPGPETVKQGDRAVWEPFLMMHNGQLVCYFSTQVDPKYNQKLSHKTTKDLRQWSEAVDDVAYPNTNQRPGMATVAYSPISKKYVMTFEYCGGPLTGGCPVYYKVSNDPLAFGSATAQPIIPNDGQLNPNGSPFVIWTPEPGKKGSGIFIANGNSREEVFVNTDVVDPNGWKPVNVGQWSAYSRELRIIQTPDNSAAEGKPKLLITNGGNIGCSGDCYNYVADGLVDIPSYPRN